MRRWSQGNCCWKKNWNSGTYDDESKYGQQAKFPKAEHLQANDTPKEDRVVNLWLFPRSIFVRGGSLVSAFKFFCFTEMYSLLFAKGNLFPLKAENTRGGGRSHSILSASNFSFQAIQVQNWIISVDAQLSLSMRLNIRIHPAFSLCKITDGAFQNPRMGRSE